MGCDNKIEINGEKYEKVATPTECNRHVVVLDRGWIFAGDLTEKDGRVRLERAVNLRHFSGVGFEGAVADPKSDKVTIRVVPAPVDFPADAEMFRLPVGDSWGL